MSHSRKTGLSVALGAVLSLLIAGVVAGCATAQPTPEPSAVSRAPSPAVTPWKLRSHHLIWGMPKQTDGRHSVVYPGETDARPGLSVLVREAFVVGHYDLMKVPAWVSVRWTQEDYERTFQGSFARNFGKDTELPVYARAGTSYDHATSKMERGHMARHDDNEAWGEDSTIAGCLMSNIVPQHKDMNGEAWNDLEEMHQEVVGDPAKGIGTIWVISGPIFEDTDGDGDEDAVQFVGNGVAVPHATYKVVGWFDAQGEFQARGYVVRQEDRVRNDPAHYLRPIDEIEATTGLDFFPELPVARANVIEGTDYDDLWGEQDPVDGPIAAVVRISSLLPNPTGDERQDEAVTIRNDGTVAVSLAGWRVRDAAQKTWALSGTIEPGDERTFTRDGQPMALNNSGDTVDLLDPSGAPTHSVSYGSSFSGVVIVVEG